jgi:hypothetical protein
MLRQIKMSELEEIGKESVTPWFKPLITITDERDKFKAQKQKLK